MRRGWNDWYHINGHTYGTWLRGDPRGWRARHHREHVEGDYRAPPPGGTFDALRRYSKRLMKRGPVSLGPEARSIACEALVASLLYQNIEVIRASVDDHHYHILARFRLPERTNTDTPKKPTGSNPWASVFL